MDKDKEIRKEDGNKSVSTNLISFFGGDKDLVVLYKKVEKLVGALYLVSNLFPFEEPVKWQLREKGVDLINLCSNLKDKVLLSEGFVLNSISSVVLSIVSLLDISHFAGFLSEMNLSVLKREFAFVTDIIEKKKKMYLPIPSSSFSFDTEFFNTGIELEKEVPKENILPVLRTNITDIKTNNVVKDTQNAVSLKGQDTKKIETVSVMGKKTDPQKDSISGMDVKKEKRKNLIIALVQKRGEISIKDVSAVVKDCSEKTIQRELLLLVKEGVLKKEGDRRWSKYSLLQ